ncbi:MAG: BON domain-containing protein [Nitrospirae bacterium]|nr:MAG: BON domain-containing protein [Nitrospirota bacterium]
MPDKLTVINAVKAALEKEPRINLHKYPIQIDYDPEDEVLTLEGEVSDIAAKKLGLELAAAVPGVRGIVDRLHVEPSVRMGDGAILDAVRDALLQEPGLQHCTIKVHRVHHNGKVEIVREALFPNPGMIEISVNDGVVLLDGHVLSLIQKRLAGVLAWWVPGSRDVINGLAVEPPEEDSDDQITEAVRLVLEKDPFVNADSIQVSTKQAVVTLDGIVINEVQRNMAEYDAWYVFGVDKVVNNLKARE